jgi:hypothetical protein
MEDQALSLSCDWAPSLPPPPASKLPLFFQSSCVSPVELMDGRGVGEEPNHRQRKSLVLYKSFIALCHNSLASWAGTVSVLVE